MNLNELNRFYFISEYISCVINPVFKVLQYLSFPQGICNTRLFLSEVLEDMLFLLKCIWLIPSGRSSPPILVCRVAARLQCLGKRRLQEETGFVGQCPQTEGHACSLTSPGISLFQHQASRAKLVHVWPHVPCHPSSLP